MVSDVIIINENTIPVFSVNTLIIGSGAASLNAAVNLFDLGQEDIAIVTDNWGGGTSNNAGSDKQTYYKLSLSGKVPDSSVEMANDLFKGGCMHGDIVLCEAQHSAQAFYHLVQLGVPFPHDKYGGYAGYKTDHDLRGRGTSAGPLTSRLMFEALAKDVKRKGIKVFDKHEVIALLTVRKGSEKHAVGAMALNRNELERDNFGLTVFNAVNVILGTGGPAGMYKTSVYPECQTGSSGTAFRIGAVGQNLTESQFGIASIKFRWNLSGSYQQVIPRYVSTNQDGNDEREFLNDFFPDMRTLTTAIFLKGYQWPFDPRRVENYGSSLIDLLVYRETVQKGRRVFIDFTRNPGGAGKMEDFTLDILDSEAYDYLQRSNALQATPIERLRTMNQPAVDIYLNNGIDLAHEYLEIAVCAQHNNGGLKGNIWWESNIRHLFPVGEVNGTHGVYRPGGAALNSGQVGGLRAATYIAKRYNNAVPPADDFITATAPQIREVFAFAEKMIDVNIDENDLISSVLLEIQDRMSGCGAHVRDPGEVKRAVSKARKLYANLMDNGRIKSARELSSAFKALDLCLTHLIYLEAIAEYLVQNGKSRGSYLVLDPDGEKSCAELGNEWRYSLNKPDALVEQKILEVYLDESSKVRKRWVDIRPIPQEEAWFEKVWKDFREGNIIK